VARLRRVFGDFRDGNGGNFAVCGMDVALRAITVPGITVPGITVPGITGNGILSAAGPSAICRHVMVWVNRIIRLKLISGVVVIDRRCNRWDCRRRTRYGRNW
jgi:hypothetical protein